MVQRVRARRAKAQEEITKEKIPSPPNRLNP
jgi:hypothetical protein